MIASKDREAIQRRDANIELAELGELGIRFVQRGVDRRAGESLGHRKNDAFAAREVCELIVSDSYAHALTIRFLRW